MSLLPFDIDYSHFFYFSIAIYWITVIDKLLQLRNEHGNKLIYIISVIALIIKATGFTNGVLFNIEYLRLIMKISFYSMLCLLVALCGIFVEKRVFNPDLPRNTPSNLKLEIHEMFKSFKGNKTFLATVLAWNLVVAGLLYGQHIDPQKTIIMITRTILFFLSFLFVALVLASNARKARIHESIKNNLDMIALCFVFMAIMEAVYFLSWIVYGGVTIIMQGLYFASEMMTLYRFSILFPPTSKKQKQIELAKKVN